MVIVKLMGGLGNQMFQYAAGRRLAYRLKTQLKLNLSWFATQTLRTYQLNVFNIEERIAGQQETDTFLNRLARNQSYFRVLLQHSRLNKSYTLFRENPAPSFIPEVLSVKGHVYLDGYWQSERYFKDITSIIKQEFTVKTEMNGQNQSTSEHIKNVNAVGLHIRRGDYVADPHTGKVHGLCSMEYYQKAVRVMCERVINPVFFIFSDDAAWAQANLKIDYPIFYVLNNLPEQGHEDLRLLSHCKHFIIANSSFSWWGAWLSTYKQKILIAPQKWFLEFPPGANADHIVPESWVKI